MFYRKRVNTKTNNKNKTEVKRKKNRSCKKELGQYMGSSKTR
jgi:hypothetical protein